MPCSSSGTPVSPSPVSPRGSAFSSSRLVVVLSVMKPPASQRATVMPAENKRNADKAGALEIGRLPEVVGAAGGSVALQQLDRERTHVHRVLPKALRELGC